MKFSQAILALMVTATTHAAMASDATTLICNAQGKSLSQTGGTLLNVDAHLIFSETVNDNGERVLINVEGHVIVQPEELAEEGSYIGNFKMDSIVENTKYKPTRYKGYSQFKNFSAANTENSAEDGMWGTLLVEKDTSKQHFQAHYIFQAGDHMGGTIHMSCTEQE